MFDAERITLDTIAALQRHRNRILNQLYFSLPLTDEEFLSPITDSPLRRRIQLLVAIANGEQHHDKGDSDIREALQSIQEVMPYLTSQDESADLITLMKLVQLLITPDKLITYREAARMLQSRVDTASLRDIKELIQTGNLTHHPDPNPRKAGRVSRNEVLRLKFSTSV